jgi:hypothetical protein
MCFMIRLGTVVLVSALCLGACGGDDDGDGKGGGVETGLDKDAKLSSLDSNDAAKVCTSLADSFNNVIPESAKKRITCSVLALPLSIKASASGQIEGDIPKCKELVTKCMNGETISSAPPAIDVDEAFISEDQCKADASESLAGCDATVGEFESCADAMLGQLSKRFDIVTCDALSDIQGLMNMSSDDLQLENIPECKALSSKCPDIDFGGSASESSGA